MRCTHLPRALLAAAMVAASFGCSDVDEERTKGALAQLSLSEQKWGVAGIRDYTIVMARSCGNCTGLVGSEVRVDVVNGVVTNQVIVSNGATLPDVARASYPNVEGLFALIRESLSKEWRNLSVQYDEARGFPLVFFIDFDATRTADDLSVTVSAFTAK